MSSGEAPACVSSYDEIAGMYHSLWADWYLPAVRPALEKLFFSEIPAGARVLDLCCGSGHVTRELVFKGFDVTGIDSSAGLIAHAREELQTVDFKVQDARALQLPPAYFKGVLSTFDSLNHILTLEGLKKVFSGVLRALHPSGLFVFDMNLEEAYGTDLREWSVNLADTSVGLVRGIYTPETKTAVTDLIWFVKEKDSDLWKQHRSSVEQRCYAQTEILLALGEAGFSHYEAVTAAEAGMNSQLGFGRVFFVARP
jgi:SAM-dependent methyltransferase